MVYGSSAGRPLSVARRALAGYTGGMSDNVRTAGGDRLPATMLAARFHAPRDVRIERVDVPTPGPGEVLVRMLVAVTCGTDLKAYRRGHPVLLGPLPAAFGHEYTGEVVAVGPSVACWQPGMRVVGANSAPCGECFFCRRGRESLCERLTLWNGAYAEYALIPAHIVARNLYVLPASVAPAAAALAEPLACALHAVEDAGVRRGDTVAILGSGALGLLLLAAARDRGARVLLCGRHTERLAVARRWGADEVLDAAETGEGEHQAEAIRARTEGGHGADVVIEAVGRPEVWQTAASAARPGGTIDLFGGCTRGTTAAFDTHSLHYEERTIKGTFHHTPHYFAAALAAIASGAVRAGELISGEVPLDDLVPALELLDQGQGIKYAIRPATAAGL
jgi:L-iditol 2-dehydrogenase